ncbi:hypothetical protein TNCV_3235591 [Trichonephila clavipes]|nr:hypothetical protein TNCV_3235591 [Trichonephila clavipes]
MALGGSLPQINLGFQGETQGGLHNLMDLCGTRTPPLPCFSMDMEVLAHANSKRHKACGIILRERTTKIPLPQIQYRDPRCCAILFYKTFPFQQKDKSRFSKISLTKLHGLPSH